MTRNATKQENMTQSKEEKKLINKNMHKNDKDDGIDKQEYLNSYKCIPTV